MADAAGTAQTPALVRRRAAAAAYLALLGRLYEAEAASLQSQQSRHAAFFADAAETALHRLPR